MHQGCYHCGIGTVGVKAERAVNNDIFSNVDSIKISGLDLNRHLFTSFSDHEPSLHCRAVYAELLANGLADKKYRWLRGLAVDTYQLQHPRVSQRKQLQSIYVHLASLYSYFVYDVPVTNLYLVRRHMMAQSKFFVWLSPPLIKSELTVADVLCSESPEMYIYRLRTWAESVFNQWHSYHDTINHWVLMLKGVKLQGRFTDRNRTIAPPKFNNSEVY